LKREQRKLKKLITQENGKLDSLLHIFHSKEQLQTQINRLIFLHQKLEDLKQNKHHIGVLTEISSVPLEPALKELMLKIDKTNSTLKCPKCGEPNRNNIINGKPYCLKCNIPLEYLYEKGGVSVKLLPKHEKVTLLTINSDVKFP